MSSHLVCHVAGLDVLIQLAKGELPSGTQLLERRLVNVIHVVALLRNDQPSILQNCIAKDKHVGSDVR